MIQTIIKLKHISKQYQAGNMAQYALRDVSFDLYDGDMLGIMGMSGSGKSTLLHIIGLLDQASSGHYDLNGQDISTLTELKRAHTRNTTLGFVFQQFYLLPRLNVMQNVSLPLIYRGVEEKISRERALEVLDKLHIADYIHRKPNELSGGQQQRVAIARALIGDPKVILADEPTGALDSKTSHTVMDLLLDLNETEKRTIIIVTHDPTLGKQCKRHITLNDGIIVEAT